MLGETIVVQVKEDSIGSIRQVKSVPQNIDENRSAAGTVFIACILIAIDTFAGVRIQYVTTGASTITRRRCWLWRLMLRVSILPCFVIVALRRGAQSGNSHDGFSIALGRTMTKPKWM